MTEVMRAEQAVFAETSGNWAPPLRRQGLHGYRHASVRRKSLLECLNSLPHLTAAGALPAVKRGGRAWRRLVWVDGLSPDFIKAEIQPLGCTTEP
jgi:hypothetical protein